MTKIKQANKQLNLMIQTRYKVHTMVRLNKEFIIHNTCLSNLEVAICASRLVKKRSCVLFGNTSREIYTMKIRQDQLYVFTSFSQSEFEKFEPQFLRKQKTKDNEDKDDADKEFCIDLVKKSFDVPFFELDTMYNINIGAKIKGSVGYHSRQYYLFSLLLPNSLVEKQFLKMVKIIMNAASIKFKIIDCEYSDNGDVEQLPHNIDQLQYKVEYQDFEDDADDEYGEWMSTDEIFNVKKLKAFKQAAKFISSKLQEASNLLNSVFATVSKIKHSATGKFYHREDHNILDYTCGIKHYKEMA